MHERKTWENCQGEYKQKIKLTLAAMELLELHLDKKSADSEADKQSLLSANNKVRNLEDQVKLLSNEVKQLKIEKHELKSKEESKNNEDHENLEGMKSQLASTVSGLKYVQNEAKNTEVKLNEAKKTIRALEEKLGIKQLAEARMQRMMDFELEQKEKLQETITKLADEIVSLRREKQKETKALEETRSKVTKLRKE